MRSTKRNHSHCEHMLAAWSTLSSNCSANGDTHNMYMFDFKISERFSNTAGIRVWVCVGSSSEWRQNSVVYIFKCQMKTRKCWYNLAYCLMFRPCHLSFSDQAILLCTENVFSLGVRMDWANLSTINSVILLWFTSKSSSIQLDSSRIS